MIPRLVLAAALALAGAAAAQPAGPMVRVETLKPVSAHVHVIPDASVPFVPNVGFVVGTRAVLVVDTGLGAENGARVAEVAKKLAPGRTIYIVATHAHPEHDLGAQAFPADAKMVRSADQSADAPLDLQLAQVFSKLTPRNAELLKGATFRPADLSFTTERTLDLGGVSARLIALGPNHTAGDTAIWVAADRVLFSGDVAMKAQPAIITPKATLAHWYGSLDRLAALKPAVVVPSHGPVGDAGFISGYRGYLEEVAHRTAEAKSAGLDLAAATAKVTEAMGARYPDRGRLAGAVKLAWGPAA